MQALEVSSRSGEVYDLLLDLFRAIEPFLRQMAAYGRTLLSIQSD